MLQLQVEGEVREFSALHQIKALSTEPSIGN